MKETVITPNGEDTPAANAGDEAEGPEVSAIPAANAESVQQVNERLLKESKKNKDLRLKAERELADIKKKALEEQGNYKAMYESLEQKHKGLIQKSIKTKIDSAVRMQAEKLGCLKPEAVLKLGDLDLLQYDEEADEVSGADHFVESVKKQIPELFKSAQTPTINPKTPGGTLSAKKISATDIARLDQVKKNEIWSKALQKK